MSTQNAPKFTFKNALGGGNYLVFADGKQLGEVNRRGGRYNPYGVHWHVRGTARELCFSTRESAAAHLLQMTEEN